jgi:hypothetical protein
VCLELARLDERLKAIQREIVLSEKHHAVAVKVASDELARRLEILNSHHEHTKEILAGCVTREVYEQWKSHIEGRLLKREGDSRELTGKLWLPLIVAAAVAAGLVAFVLRGLGGT